MVTTSIHGEFCDNVTLSLSSRSCCFRVEFVDEVNMKRFSSLQISPGLLICSWSESAAALYPIFTCQAHSMLHRAENLEQKGNRAEMLTVHFSPYNWFIASSQENSDQCATDIWSFPFQTTEQNGALARSFSFVRNDGCPPHCQNPAKGPSLSQPDI